MSNKSEYMKEAAETHLAHGDVESYDAIMMAIDEPAIANKKYPKQKEAIKNALDYANRETWNGRFI